MTVTPLPGSEEARGTAYSPAKLLFRCEICKKEFVSEAQLAFHRDIEHVKHLPVSGVA